MNIIVACDRNWGIGKDGHLLCHLSGDLRYFKEMTIGKTVVMGRVTLESLPGGKALPGRRNIVLTRNPDFTAEGVETADGMDDLDDLTSGTDTDDVFIIGGAKVYDQFINLCRNIYVTKIDAEFEADAYFRDLDKSKHFYAESKSEVMEENGIRYQFVKYVREHNEGGRR